MAGKRQMLAMPTAEPMQAMMKPHLLLKPSCFCRFSVLLIVQTLLFSKSNGAGGGFLVQCMRQYVGQLLRNVQKLVVHRETGRKREPCGPGPGLV